MLRNEILIFFQQPVFWSGDTITGYIQLICPIESLFITKVEFSFLSYESLLIQGHDDMNHIFYEKKMVLNGPGSGNGRKDENDDDRIMNRIKKEIYDKKKGFWEKMKGIKNNLFEKREIVTELKKGSYEYMFSIRLPKRLPPSCELKNEKDGTVIKIMYNVGIVVYTPKGITELSQNALVKVLGSQFDLNFIGNISIQHTVSDTKTFAFAKGALHTTILIPTQLFYSGSLIKGEILYTNKSSKQVNNTKISFVQNISYVLKGENIKFRKILAETVIDGVKKYETVKNLFTINIPDDLIESIFHTELEDCESLKLIKVNYQLIIEGEISFATNLRMKVGVYIVRSDMNHALLNRAKNFESLKNRKSNENIILPPVPKIERIQPKNMKTNDYFGNKTNMKQDFEIHDEITQDNAPTMNQQLLPPVSYVNRTKESQNNEDEDEDLVNYPDFLEPNVNRIDTTIPTTNENQNNENDESPVSYPDYLEPNNVNRINTTIPTTNENQNNENEEEVSYPDYLEPAYDF